MCREQVVQQAEIANLRRLPQEGEPDHVLQGLPAGYVRVPDRELLLRVVHRVRARVQEAGHSVAALAKIHQMSNRLGPVLRTCWPVFRSTFSLIHAYFDSSSSSFSAPFSRASIRAFNPGEKEKEKEKERERERERLVLESDRSVKFSASHRVCRPRRINSGSHAAGRSKRSNRAPDRFPLGNT